MHGVRVIAVVWVLAGCGRPQPPITEAPQRAARVREPHLDTTTVGVGAPFGARIAFAEPGVSVRLYAGDGIGAGACPPMLGGACLSILDAHEIGTHHVEPDGTAMFRPTLPAAVVAGDTITFQAVIETYPPTLTNAVSRTAVVAPSEPIGGNILVVVLDDVGTDKLAVYGSPNPAPTPTIDALAANGVTFDAAYARPVCSPARAALQTGRHGRRTGLGINLRVGSDEELGLGQLTLAEIIEMSPYFDYKTALVGKWHLGTPASPSGYQHPVDQGWDWYTGSFGNLNGEGSPSIGYFDWLKVLRDGTTVRTSTYATTDTIDDAIALGTSMHEPWMLMVSLNAAHLPTETPPASLTPVAVNGGAGYRVRSMTEAADTEIGRLLAAFPAGVHARTTVVLTSDNGTHEAQAQPPVAPERAKGTLFDGGVRVPLIIAGRAVSAPRGSRSSALVDHVDLLPTIAELVGADLSTLTSVTDEAQPYELDGASLLPQLADPAVPTSREFVYSELFSPNGPGPYTASDRQMVRDANYKLIVDNLGGVRMFFEYVAGADDEGPNLLTCGLTPTQQAAYDRLSAYLDAETGELAYDADPTAPPLPDTGFPTTHDTAADACDTGP